MLANDASPIDSTTLSITLGSNNKLIPRKIQINHLDKGIEYSKVFSSLNSAATYIKNIDGSVDKATMRKYINSEKLYKNKWKLIEIE